MEIEGLIISDLGPKDGVSKVGKPWKKHEWLLETSGQYPRKVKFTVFGDRTETITFECGKRYVIQVDVESREYNGNWYTDLTAYNYRLLEEGATTEGPNFNPGVQTPAQAAPAAAQAVPQNPFSNGASSFTMPQEDNDNLPF